MGLIVIPKSFGLVTVALPSDLDANFSTLINLLNGNLDDTNVNKAANSLKVGGFSVFVVPTANSVPVLDSNAKLPYAAKPAFRGALTYKSANQTLTTGVATILSFDTNSYDTDTLHNTVTNNSRITVPSGVSKVRLSGIVQFAQNGTGYRRAEILKNGGAFAGAGYQEMAPQSSTVQTCTPVSSIVPVVAGDYFELRATQTSGGNLDLISGVGACAFCMEIIE